MPQAFVNHVDLLERMNYSPMLMRMIMPKILSGLDHVASDA
jgi:hypothetical protein